MSSKSKRLVAAGGGLAAGVTAMLILAAIGHSSPSGPPALRDPNVPRMTQDLGTGEQLILVIGGFYNTQQEAQTAAVSYDFGDLQGYYVVPTGDYLGLTDQFPDVGGWMLASAFRTTEGAQEFQQLAWSTGAPAWVSQRVTSLGGTYAGLGQEAAPDGSGPLTHSVPASEAA